MVKRNTIFKQMFLADNNLLDAVNSKAQSFYNNTNKLAYIQNKNQSCAECDNSKVLKKLPFPETIKDSNGNIDTIIRDESSSNSESSSDDENGDNNLNSNNQRMIQPSSSYENIDSSSNQRINQPQQNGEDVYNSLNQRIIHPLQNHSPSSSSNESDTENIDSTQNFQNLHSRSEYFPTDDILRLPNNITQENSSVHIADPTQTEMEITDDGDQIRQNMDLTNDEEEFTAPLPEEQFMDINVPNISQHSRPANKMKRLKSKIRRKHEDAQRKIRMKQEDAQRKSRKVISPIKDIRTSQLHDERPLDEDEEMLSDSAEKNETYDNERKKRNKKDSSNLLRSRKQFKRIEKLKLLKQKQQRLKQLYLENKNQKMKDPQSKDEMEDIIDDKLSNHDDHLDDISKMPTIKLRKFAYGTMPQQENINRLDESNDADDKSNEYVENQKEDIPKRPRIQLRKSAYGEMPEQENISHPEIRVVEFANQKHLKNKENISNNLQYLCELCRIHFPKYSSLKQHLQENHKKEKYKIEFPDQGKYLALGRKVKHGNNGKQFFYQNINMNNEDATDLTSYWCSKCQKFFKSFKSMQSHMQKHENGEATAKRSITKDRPLRQNKKMFYKAY